MKSFEAFYIRKYKPELNSREECIELGDLLFKSKLSTELIIYCLFGYNCSNITIICTANYLLFIATTYSTYYLCHPLHNSIF